MNASARTPPASPWAWRIGAIAGIPVRVHVTLILLLAWIGLSSWFIGLGPTSSLAGLLLVVIVFGLIVLHESAHALMARRFGVKTRDILLLPFGGVASLEKIPERPGQELAVAIVGPAVNVVIAGLLGAGLVIAGRPLDPLAATSLPEAFIARLLWINVLLAGFNLLPAFPLDGGRALRALLAMRTDRRRATEIAAATGRVLAALMVFIGLWINIWFVLIGIVIWIGAGRERDLTRLHDALHGVPVSLAMSRRIESIDAGTTLGAAASRMLDAGVSVAPVIDHGEIVGAITPDEIVRGARVAGGDAPVGATALHPVVNVAPGDSLDRVLDVLTATPSAVVIVVEDGIPRGIVTPDRLVTYAMLHPQPPGASAAAG